ncbi:MAG TPA: hypothetical protein PKB02_02535 [Anaerohalosphaeraceae bacterium]|nr:hypothetical protein [Anaerohalosphaeraceae bacterium]
MQLTEKHIELDEQGIGRCSVPMWCCGMPAGFCDEPAYGERPPSKEYRDATGRLWRLDGKYDGYVPGLACPAHGGPSIRVFKDGDKFCAVGLDFEDLQTSKAGFGDTKDEAISQYKAALMAKEG